MSSDDGIDDYHRSNKSHYHQQLSLHNENSNGPSSHSLTSASTQTINCCDINGVINGGTIKRRKSTSTGSNGAVGASSTVGPSVTNLHTQSHHNDNSNDVPINSGSSNSNNIIKTNGMASPSRYIHHNDGIYFHVAGSNSCIPSGNRLSIHHPNSNDRYDSEITTCCLPPPSPAPNSDRFIMGMPSPSMSAHHQQQHFQQNPVNDHKFSTIHHRSMSPSSRYKNSMSDRYRDISPKCDRFLPPPHYLANSTPLVSSGGSVSNISMVGGNSIVTNSPDYMNSYLSTTVHTPIKRYIPSTNSVATDIYSEPLASTHTHQQQASAATNTINGYHHLLANNSSNNLLTNSHPHGSHLPQMAQSQPHTTPRNTSQSNSNLPYRYRMKCCSNMDQTIANGAGTTSTEDLYATPPRTRQINTKLTISASTQSTSAMPSSGSSSSTLSSAINSSNNNDHSLQRSDLNNHGSDHIIHRIVEAPTIDYSGGAAGANIMSNALPACDAYGPTYASTSTIMAAPNVPPNNGNGTCLHCNTIRRTTAVHQTTQTTGPVSPIPQNMNAPTGQVEMDACMNTSNGNNALNGNPPMSYQSTQVHSFTIQNRGGFRLHQSQMTQQQSISPTQPLQSQDSLVPEDIDQSPHSSRKHQIKLYVKREVAKFFGVDSTSEERERIKWTERQKRLALRRFGSLKSSVDPFGHNHIQERRDREQHSDRPDILPVDHTPHSHHHSNYHHNLNNSMNNRSNRRHTLEDEIDIDDDDDDDAELEERSNESNSVINQHLIIERKASVPTMLWLGLQYAIQALSKKVPQNQRQWSRSFAPQFLSTANINQNQMSDNGSNSEMFENAATPLQDNEIFFDVPNSSANNGTATTNTSTNTSNNGTTNKSRMHHSDPARQLYMSGERTQSGWLVSSTMSTSSVSTDVHGQQATASTSPRFINSGSGTYRGTRISSHLLDGVLDNSRRPSHKKLKLLHVHELDDRYDHRPYFTYWINTVQILVMCLTLICYGFGPIGIGMEQKSGQVLVTSLSLQQVQHQEPRNFWLGPRGDDLIHLGAKFAACMRRDYKILDVMAKTRRQERETACCIRNDDSGCVQSSQADCSVRGLWPTKSISTWKKWSPGDSGPGGRISGSVCGLDPKYCDAPASIAPYEWPDDITKWPICRKTNSFSQRFRYKDHTAEHMVCEVIGHPCCISVYGECRITTREFCDFVNGYFHEEASLCSQVSCLNDICGMFPFISPDTPDQFYRLFTSLCLHAGIVHLAITVAFQHIFMADLERLLGPIRLAILYIGCGIAGNLISSIFLPYKPEVGPLASIAGVVSSMAVLLIMIHWKQLKRPHLALMKIIFLAMCIFAIGTLPWQQHILGLMGGIVCGVVLTITMVPFLSITKYERKSKINLIWMCILLHVIIYATMLILFYLFPMALSSIGFWGTDSTNIHNPYNGAIGGSYSVGGNIVACDNNKGMQCGGTTGNSPGGIVRSAINI